MELLRQLLQVVVHGARSLGICGILSCPMCAGIHRVLVQVTRTANVCKFAFFCLALLCIEPEADLLPRRRPFTASFGCLLSFSFPIAFLRRVIRSHKLLLLLTILNLPRPLRVQRRGEVPLRLLHPSLASVLTALVGQHAKVLPSESLPCSPYAYSPKM